MYCRKCGTWCEDSAVFCTQCGEPLGEKTTKEGGAAYNEAAAGTNINAGYTNDYHTNYREGYSSMNTYAGFWNRFLAIVIDGIILSIVNGIIAIALKGIGLTSITELISILIGWFYYAYMESSEYQGTLGKLALQLRVTDLFGERITFARATGRYFGKYISGLILCIGYMMAGWTEKKQALHDIMAGTLVVNE